MSWPALSRAGMVNYEVVHVAVLLFNLVLFAFCQGLAQVALQPVDPGPEVHTPYPWVRFQDTDYLAAVTRGDLGIRGPVATITTKHFWAESDEDLPGEQLRLGTRGAGPMAVRHTFDEHGYLRLLEQLDANDEPYAKHVYSAVNGIYTGYELYADTRASDGWVLRETLEREVVSDRKVVITVRSHVPQKNKVLHLLYDEGGLLVAEERYDLDGTFRNRTTYRYVDGRLVEKSDAASTSRYQYTPESQALGPGLLVARRGFNRGSFKVLNQEGEFVPVNSDNESLLRAGSDYFYRADGSLAEIRHFRVAYAEGAIGVQLASGLERFRDGLLIEETSYNFNMITEAIVHEYEASRLIRTSERNYRQDGTVTASQCENRNFDRYGNWTVRRCTPIVDEEALELVLDPFRGRTITRVLTYH